MRKVFLACPYGHPDGAVVEERFELSNAVAAKIARAGGVVFSQVSMSHPINRHLGDLDKAGISALWAPIDQSFMQSMEELIVIDAPGWKDSSGVAREIRFFEDRGRRVSLWSDVEAEFAG
ncbi:DUF1937 family protein [Lichenihabitans sp. Uapishka_5]|uniref:DUF1937 family protein n=1 Tax=Lichenihabitans sp. Uapishka_5 TaxID=3037302 RepID=UPI0029E807EF|nr:DUF1937 family protein [Lichenihabitans sp. Uapishka_5]MDX7951374.1 DUF1937 family protein [Lichenihabitans sp. Uapishka_5]